MQSFRFFCGIRPWDLEFGASRLGRALRLRLDDVEDLGANRGKDCGI